VGSGALGCGKPSRSGTDHDEIKRFRALVAGRHKAGHGMKLGSWRTIDDM
jgi:hypothetical protein